MEENEKHINNILKINKVFKISAIAKVLNIQKDTFRNNVLGLLKKNNFSEEDKANISIAVFPAVKQLFNCLDVEISIGVSQELTELKAYNEFLLSRITDQQKEIESLKFKKALPEIPKGLNNFKNISNNDCNITPNY